MLWEKGKRKVFFFFIVVQAGSSLLERKGEKGAGCGSRYEKIDMPGARRKIKKLLKSSIVYNCFMVLFIIYTQCRIKSIMNRDFFLLWYYKILCSTLCPIIKMCRAYKTHLKHKKVIQCNDSNCLNLFIIQLWLYYKNIKFPYHCVTVGHLH